MARMEARILMVLRGQRKNPIGIRELMKKAKVAKSERDAFQEIIDGMIKQNKLMEKSSKLILAENLGLVGATIVKVNNTFGFAKPDGGDKDIFIPGRFLAGSMPGDTVLLKVTKGTGELPEGEVFKVTHEAAQRFAAVLEILEDGSARVMPDRLVKFPLQVNAAKLMGAKNGNKVLCEISHRGKRHSEHRARILETFGSSETAAACCHAVLAANDINSVFPDEVLEQAQAIAAGEGIHPKELSNRMDLRESVIFTIDGADSKDLDDAVSVGKNADGSWELGVHIADVSYYVTHLTPIDKEALARGTSTYYADAVIPMLPAELSNGICSLNPGEDRLAFSALLKLDARGNLTGYRFVKTVIRSRVKGIYSEVNAILAGTADPALLKKYAGLTDALADMKELAAVLSKSRFARGGINLETTESKIILDETGRAVDVQPRERGLSEMMIEEFMLSANEAAATLALEKKLPFVFRVHENPSPDRVSQLFDVLEQLGVKARRPKGEITALQLSGILDKVRDTPLDRVVNTMVLRAMAKAKYSENNVGHFGLALENYTHFTSPIRRYPDLTIHRILSAYVTGMKRENLEKRFRGFVAESANRSSVREVASMTAERSCEDCYKAEFMRNHLGEEITGVIASVVSFGIYVQLPSTVEGLVHISNFPAGEWSAEGSLSFVERQTGLRLRLGDTVKVRVAGADVSAGVVDFVLI